MALHILFVAPFGLRQKATVWARTLPIAQQLVAAGHRATIIVPPWDSPEDAGRIETHEGVHLEQVSLDGGLLGTLRRMVQRIDQVRPEIVHIVKPRAHAGLVQWWLWQRRSAAHYKIVLDVDDWEQAWNPINRYKWHIARFLSWQEEWGIRHAHGITTASRWLENKATTIAPDIPTFYLPNGVAPLTELPVPPMSSAGQEQQILFFTRFIEVPPQWLRDFWITLHAQFPTAQLLIAGTPVQKWLAEPFHQALEGVPGVRWTGYVPTSVLREMYARVTCAIFPAQPLPLLQAKCSVRLATTLLHGVPVVASAVGEQISYGADGAAHLVDAEATPQEFAQVVAELLQNPSQEGTSRGEAANRLLERYAWSNLTSDLPAFYETISNQS